MSKIVFGVIIVFVIICLIVIFVIILFKLYIQKIKTYNQLLHQKEIDKQKAITETIIETQESTLEHLSNELHDDAGQQLTYINLQLEQLKLANPNLKENIAPINSSVYSLSETIRNLSHRINQQKIKQTNLINSIASEINRINKFNILQCSFDVANGFSYNFYETERIVLFRIFQEITNNTFKHSKASNFRVSITQTPKIKLTFKDDGIGFNSKTKDLTLTSGIINLKHRSKLINFTFNLESSPKQGTTIVLTKTDT